MKRVLSLLIFVVLVAACFVAPVSAASDYEGGELVDVLEYGNAIESERNFLRFNGSTSMNFTTPFVGGITYVDVLFRFWTSSGATVENVSLLRQGEFLHDLEFIHVGGQFFRAIGSFTYRSFNTVGISLTVSNDGDYSYLAIDSFKVGAFNRTTADLDGRAEIHVNSKTTSITHSPSSMGFYSWDVTGDNDEADFSMDLSTPNNWQKYDYIDFVFSLNVSDINSISVTQNGSPVPFEVSYIDSTSMPSSAFYVVVRVDQTNIDRSTPSNYPVLVVWGNSHYTSINAITIVDIVGHVKFTSDNPIVFWFKKTYTSVVDGFNNVVNNLKTGFAAVVDAIIGNSDEVDAITGDMDEAGDALEDAAAAFDKIEYPDIDINSIIGDYTNFSQGGLAILACVTSNAQVTSMLFVVFSFALIGYILFGKKR